MSKAPLKTMKSTAKYTTVSGIELDPFYSVSSLPKDLENSLGIPGQYPFTRGIHPDMYAGKLWTMRQYAGFGTAAETNQRFRYLLEQGSTGLSVAFDLPTQMGRDSDDSISKGEVGKVGVAISCLKDMEVLLEDIPLEKVSISMTINATAATLLAFLLVVAEKRGVAWDKLRGTVQNDILKEYIARGTYIYPAKAGLKLAVDLCQFCVEAVPNWNTVSVSGYHMREAGCTAVEELAFTLADGIAYVESLLARGLEIDSFAPRLAFFFNAHNEFLEEVAKFRAARRLWARIMKERFGAKDPKSMMLRFHTQTAGSSLTAQQPHNNVVRTTLQALAAVFGGTQSLHTNGFDEALALPSAESASLALRTQQILAYESGVASNVDPFAGSFLIEKLTDSLEFQASAMIDKITEMGGMVEAIEAGFPQETIERSAYIYQQEVESGKRKVVGVNCFQQAQDSEVELQAIDAKGELEQHQRLAELRKNRDSAAWQRCMEQLAQVAKQEGNLLPVIIEAARKGATLGEISGCLRKVFGEYRGKESI